MKFPKNWELGTNIDVELGTPKFDLEVGETVSLQVYICDEEGTTDPDVLQDSLRVVKFKLDEKTILRNLDPILLGPVLRKKTVRFIRLVGMNKYFELIVPLEQSTPEGLSSIIEGELCYWEKDSIKIDMSQI